MATPQYGNMIVALGSPKGPRKNVRVYLSDAAGAITYPDGSSELNLSSKDVYIVDFFTPTAMATMVSLAFYAGGTLLTTLPATTEIATTQIRTFMQSPTRIPGGASLRIVQA